MGRKQGHWIYFGKNSTLPGYAPEAKVEEGDYMSNFKNGIWKMYYEDGKMKHELTYKRNQPNGHAKFYYRNGKVSEEGLWKSGKWHGEYVVYHENGNKKYEWNYTNGKRTGEQKYFHENGKPYIVGNWDGGRETGEQKEWDEKGNLVATRVYDEPGVMNAEKSVFKEKPEEKAAENTEQFASSDDVVVEDNPSDKGDPLEIKVNTSGGGGGENIGMFSGNGYHKLKNRYRQVTHSGLFQNGKLVDGELYHYKPNGGALTKTQTIKNGRVVEEKEAGQ
jgi:antitoxin component YwqK of YwqJK toxin-antitoxin module